MDAWKALAESLNRTLVNSTASPGDVARLDVIAQAGIGEPSAGYALALAVSRLHAVRDSFLNLDRLNSRLLDWHAAQAKPIEAPLALAPHCEAWAIVLADGLAQAGLHSETVSDSRDALCQALIRKLAEATTSDRDLQRLRLRGLTTALAYSQLTGNLPVRIELDAIAAQCIACLSDNPAEVGRWWAERTLMEIFTFLTERRVDSSIADLLAATEGELAAQPDAITHFQHCRNLFEWARVEKDLPRARQALAALQKARTAVGPGGRALSIVLLRAKAALAIDTFDYLGAEKFTRDAIAVAEEIAASSNQRMSLWTTLVVALAVQERAADAALAAETAASYALAQHRDILTTVAHLLHARAKWPTEYTAAMAHLQSAMLLARKANFSQFFNPAPALAAWVAARALDHNIEPTFVAELVSRRSLPPPADAGPQWPWAVRIRLLGGSSIEGETVNRTGAGKAQQKPLDIIQLLAIAGPKGLDRVSLARAIYGSALLDSPATLNMAISRARRVLGDDSLIDSQSGRIQLDSRRVYVDLWAMQALKAASDEEAGWHCNRLLELYAGPLLHGSASADKHRIVAATARDRFVGLIIELSARVPLDQAIDVLHQAIARANVAEPLYRALIERLTQRGDAAEAVEVYQQCELALSQAYRVAPSERTQRLIEMVRKNTPPRIEPTTTSTSPRKGKAKSS